MAISELHGLNDNRRVATKIFSQIVELAVSVKSCETTPLIPVFRYNFIKRYFYKIVFNKILVYITSV